MSPCVATYTTSWTPLPEIVTWETYSGWAATALFTDCENNFPNWVEFTFEGVRIVSFRFCPVRAMSLCAVRTLTCAFAALPMNTSANSHTAARSRSNKPAFRKPHGGPPGVFLVIARRFIRIGTHGTLLETLLRAILNSK